MARRISLAPVLDPPRDAGLLSLVAAGAESIASTAAEKVSTWNVGCADSAADGSLLSKTVRHPAVCPAATSRG